MVSKQEQRVFDAIRNKFARLQIIQSYRPDILQNVKTGKNFEIDIFLPEFKIGFEYQGRPHFEVCKNMNNNPDRSRENDINKIEIMKRVNNFSIVELFEDVLSGNIIENICNSITSQFDSVGIYSSDKKKRLTALVFYLTQDNDLMNIKLSHSLKKISGKTTNNAKSRITLDYEFKPIERNKVKKDVLNIDEPEMVSISRSELRLLDNIAYYSKKLISLDEKSLQYLYIYDKLKTDCIKHRTLFN